MRCRVFWLFASVVLVAATVPAYGDVIFTLDSNTGSGSPTNLPPDADFCIQPNCVLFTGTLFDTDTDGSIISLNNLPISVSFSTSPATGSLTLDNTFYDDVLLILSGDPNYASDGNFPNLYGPSQPIFGIDIAPETSVGIYSGTITISAAGGTGDPNFNGFTVSQDFTVNVLAPEPAAIGLAFAGLALLAWRGMKCKWHSSEVSR